MAKKAITINADNVKDAVGKLNKAFDEMKDVPFIITEAAIKDDFCTYKFEITSGIGLGDSHKVDGSGIIDDDMRTAFSKFNVHLAAIDDVFKHSGIEIDDIDKFHTEELTGLYHVTGFQIKGGKDNECIVLTGNKYVSTAGGRIELKSPKIPLDNLSSYKWYNELKAAADEARNEVRLYKEGKYTAVEIEEDVAEEKTGNLFDQGEKIDSSELMADFEKAEK